MSGDISIVLYFCSQLPVFLLSSSCLPRWKMFAWLRLFYLGGPKTLKTLTKINLSSFKFLPQVFGYIKESQIVHKAKKMKRRAIHSEIILVNPVPRNDIHSDHSQPLPPYSLICLLPSPEFLSCTVTVHFTSWPTEVKQSCVCDDLEPRTLCWNLMCSAVATKLISISLSPSNPSSSEISSRTSKP